MTQSLKMLKLDMRVNVYKICTCNFFFVITEPFGKNYYYW